MSAVSVCREVLGLGREVVETVDPVDKTGLVEARPAGIAVATLMNSPDNLSGTNRWLARHHAVLATVTPRALWSRVTS